MSTSSDTPASARSDTPTSALSPNARGSLLMVVAMIGFALNDAFVKLATAEISPAQIMAVRGTMAVLLLGAIAAYRGVGRPSSAMLKGPVLVRAAADVAATISYITALSQLPLANVTAILQALPLTVTLGAVVFFGERPGWRRWSAIGIGLVGVLLIIRPGGEGFNLFSLAVIASVLACTLRDLVTRKVPDTTPSILVSGVTAVLVTLFGFALLPVSGWQPMSGPTLLTLGLSALSITVGYLAIVSATRRGEVGVIAPYRYTILPVAFVLGILLFGEAPTLYDIAGSVIVVASGIYVFYRERRLGNRPATPAAVR